MSGRIMQYKDTLNFLQTVVCIMNAFTGVRKNFRLKSVRIIIKLSKYYNPAVNLQCMSHKL